MGTNEGFTEVTNKSNFTRVKSFENCVSTSDLLYFAEANGYCWNFAHDFMWCKYKYDGYSSLRSGHEIHLSEVDEFNYHPFCKELLKRFMRVYNIPYIVLLPKGFFD